MAASDQIVVPLPDPSVLLHTDWNHLAPVRLGVLLTAGAVVLDLRSDRRSAPCAPRSR
jgi:hypothetical protein